jgi:hypothetical protein
VLTADSLEGLYEALVPHPDERGLGKVEDAYGISQTQ